MATTSYFLLCTASENIVTFFFCHIFLGLVWFNSKLKVNINRHYTLLYFLFINFLCLLLILLRIYLSTIYDLDFSLVSGVNPEVSIFGDTLICLVLFTSVFSWLFLSERHLFKFDFFIFFFFVFGVCTISMVSTSNLLQMFIYFELMFLPSLVFVYKFGYAKKVTKSILFLLTWTLTGSFLVLMGVAYLYGVYGLLDVNSLYLLKFSSIEKHVLFFVFFIGFGIKIPLWPFYYWLIKVHVEAPTGFSIFLSGFLVKTAFYCLMFFYSLFSSKITNAIAEAIIVWGVLDASVRMWGALDVKKLIAYATVQEMNLIMLFVLVAGNNNNTILNLFILVHGILSALFFFLVDQVQKQFGSRNTLLLAGLSLFAPILTATIWAGLLIFRGFPIFVKFIIEWELAHLLYINFHLLGVLIFFLFSLYGVLGFCKVWFTVIYGQPAHGLNSSEMLKRDVLVGGVLVFFLTILGSLVAFF